MAIDKVLPSKRRQKQALASDTSTSTSHGLSRFSVAIDFSLAHSSLSGRRSSKAFHDSCDSFMLTLKLSGMPGVFLM